MTRKRGATLVVIIILTVFSAHITVVTTTITDSVALVLGFAKGADPDTDNEVSQIKQYLIEMGLLGIVIYAPTEGISYCARSRCYRADNRALI